jgi:hypothetical protein
MSLLVCGTSKGLGRGLEEKKQPPEKRRPKRAKRRAERRGKDLIGLKSGMEDTPKKEIRFYKASPLGLYFNP